MKTNDQIANWAMDLQSLAQAGLRYGHDVFDRERYEEIRRIAGEMMSARTGIPEEKLKTLFLGDEGYQTPKIDTRAAIFKDNRILLVREKRHRSGHCLVAGMIMIKLLLKIALKKLVKKREE